MAKEELLAKISQEQSAPGIAADPGGGQAQPLTETARGRGRPVGSKNKGKLPAIPKVIPPPVADPAIAGLIKWGSSLPYDGIRRQIEALPVLIEDRAKLQKIASGIPLSDEEAASLSIPVKQLIQYYFPVMEGIGFVWTSLALQGFGLITVRLAIIKEIKQLKEDILGREKSNIDPRSTGNGKIDALKNDASGPAAIPAI